jgi:hypothetical protein
VDLRLGQPDAVSCHPQGAVTGHLRWFDDHAVFEVGLLAPGGDRVHAFCSSSRT